MALPVHSSQHQFQRMHPIDSARLQIRQRTPAPRSQSQYLCRGCKSLLPTSLSYACPWAGGCSPLIPDAVISTHVSGQKIHTNSYEQLTVYPTRRNAACPVRMQQWQAQTEFNCELLSRRKVNSPQNNLLPIGLKACRHCKSTYRPGNMYNASFRAC